MTLSQSQLRLISSIGIGILVGTSLIVIIPEGIEAVVSTSTPSTHSHQTRQLESSAFVGIHGVAGPADLAVIQRAAKSEGVGTVGLSLEHWILPRKDEAEDGVKIQTGAGANPTESPGMGQDEHRESKLPTFYVGLALITGFVLMFLVDRLPRHAADNLHSGPTPRHISLDNLASTTTPGEEETDGFLGSLAPTPKQSRSIATTTGLVIHAAADGIAMGASATTADMKLGFIIFAAIMIHKAPAAFGLTSVLLKQGLSKRAARGHLIVFSLAAPFGALATYFIISLVGGANMDGPTGQWWTGMLLLFSAGTFLSVPDHLAFPCRSKH